MKAGKVLVVALCLVWSVTTVNQVFRWGHPLHLWRQAIEESPDKPRPWNNLGAHYLLDRAEPFAIHCFQRSTRLARAFACLFSGCFSRSGSGRRGFLRFLKSSEDALVVGLESLVPSS